MIYRLTCGKYEMSVRRYTETLPFDLTVLYSFPLHFYTLISGFLVRACASLQF